MENQQDRPTAWGLFFIFARIGLTSFGGGLSGWFMREFVDRRQLISRDEFLNGLALSQALPGVNVKNLAIWIGYRVCGRWGAVAGFFGTIAPSAIFIILLATVFASLTKFTLTEMLLEGAGAAAIGLSLSMGFIACRHLPRKLFPLGLAAATFVSIGILHWSLVYTVIVGGAVGFAHSYFSEGA
ncbi:chromate transporter [Neorhizobium sp. P12A]|jgi:chromate transporter|uniref:chromate transporter n=1 Tax=Rhizobium/Agrobacterium group TaxID=227290 RepID=UPI001047136E|nr:MULTISPECIES: chromate transporter [Rhizobium/Agrobacterium group]KAA0697253.1 chromate transporter [Neorhizobium sp. P12A]TCR85880.1 chromate transporter [Rhizobium sp. BK376]